jgi:hypothetical protein
MTEQAKKYEIEVTRLPIYAASYANCKLTDYTFTIELSPINEHGTRIARMNGRGYNVSGPIDAMIAGQYEGRVVIMNKTRRYEINEIKEV